MALQLATLLLLSLFTTATFAQPQKITNPFSTGTSHLFTSRLQFQENTFTGYLALKYENENNFRINITSGMGSTLIDLEWKDGKFIKHFIPEKLDHKIVINKLQDDFEMMMLHILAEGKWKDPGTLKVGCHKYRFTETPSYLPITIEDHNWIGRLKRTANYTYDTSQLLKSIQLKHHSFALQIDLTTIE